jgi:integrase
MAGQIIARGKGTWLLRVFLGRDPATNKRVYSNETFHGTKKETDIRLVDLLKDRNAGALKPGSDKRTIDTLLDDLVHDYRENGQDVAWAERIVEKNLRPAFGKIRIAKFETEHARRYIAEKRAASLSTAYINRDMALLRRAFNLGRKTTPPKVTLAPYIPISKENNVRKGFFEHWEYTAMRDALPDELKGVLTFAYYTGCRHGEILSLEWRQVDLIERVVYLDPGTTKNDASRTAPLAPELFQTLALQRAVRDARYPSSPWVFSRDGKRILDFRGAWETACRVAGLWKDDKKTRLFHDLRRSGVRNLVRAGVPERTAMYISGHKTRSIFNRYNITSEGDVKDAGRKLGDYIDQGNKQSAERRTIGTQDPKSDTLKLN